MRVADHLVSSRICCASAFERKRLGNMHGLYRRPLGFPQDYQPVAKGDVCFCIRLPAGACSSYQATPDPLRPQRSPASWRLN